MWQITCLKQVFENYFLYVICNNNNNNNEVNGDMWLTEEEKQEKSALQFWKMVSSKVKSM